MIVVILNLIVILIVIRVLVVVETVVELVVVGRRRDQWMNRWLNVVVGGGETWIVNVDDDVSYDSVGSKDNPCGLSVDVW